MMLSGIVVLILLMASCGRRSALRTATPTALPTATPTLAPTATPTTTFPASKNAEAGLAILDRVWQTVAESYFDPDFGGVDWQAAREHYEPLIARAETEQERYRLLNQMLWELKVSHAAVGPAEMWPAVEPAIWMAGKTGLDARLLEGEAVVTRVEPGSPAAQAGLRSGFVLERVGSTPVEQIIAEAEVERSPPYNEAGRIDHLTRAILAQIFGPPDTCVTLTWRDEKDEPHERCVERVQRERSAPLEGLPLPPSYLEFEARPLGGEIGYLRFNTFHPALIPELVATVQSMIDLHGIIVDLRGNPGGSIPPVEALATQFLEEQMLLGRWQTREVTIDWVVQPVERPFQGSLIILIDRLSFSGSECFASAMQAVGRGIVVGVRSSGGVTGANIAQLPDGGLLMYPVAQLITPAGIVPEGRGVIPDLEVELNRDLLLRGIDSQLEAAIDYMTGQENDEAN